MHKLTHRPLYRHLSLLLVALLTLSLTVGGLPGWTQIREVTPAAVLPVVDNSESQDPIIADKATDALVMALEDSGSYRVHSRNDLDRELRALDLQPPLSEREQIRLGNRLQVERVFTATLTELAVNPNTGEVRAGLELRALDINIEAVLNGSNVKVVTKSIPGWSGNVVPVINEALREVAEKAVIEMEKTRIRTGSVLLVDDQGVITVKLGVNDGVGVGTRLLVMRGYWQPDREDTIMRRIGTMELTEAQVGLSAGKVVEGQMPRIGDRLYALYTPPAEVQEIMRGRHRTQALRIGAALGLLLGVLATATGSQNISPPGVDALLYQQSPGQQPVIRVNMHRGLNPDPEKTHAWLIYRGPSAGFPAAVDDSNYLVGAVAQKALDFWEDWPQRVVGLNFNLNFTFFGRTGEEEDGNVEITYNHLELIAGNSYYYKVRRVVDPWRPIIPIAAQQEEEELADVDFAIDPEDALGEASDSAGPVTYSAPANLLRPTLATPVDPSNASFEWTPSLGADEYQVQVYDSALLTRRVTSSPIQTWLGETVMRYTFTDFTFQGDTTYWWVVGSRASGERQPQCDIGSRSEPWVLSDKASFKTVTLPPPGPSSAASGRPSTARGWFNEQRLFPLP